MKKLGLALVLTLAFGAGSVFAQNANSSTTGGSAGGTMTAKHSRRHHRRAKATTGNTNS